MTTPTGPFSLIEHDAFDHRRTTVRCTYCAAPVGLHTNLTPTPSGRWAHQTCHDTLTARTQPARTDQQ